MSTQFTVRTQGRKRSLKLTTTLHDGIALSTTREEGQLVFEVPPDDDIEIEVVVRRKGSAAADMNDAIVNEAAACGTPGNYVVLKRTSEGISNRAANAKFDWSPNGTAKLILPIQSGRSSPIQAPAAETIPAQDLLPTKSDMTWNRHYTALVKFQRDNGHCRVPGKYAECPRLATWISSQRISFKDGTLSKERMEKLIHLGLSWDPWMEKYNQLVQYKCQFGDCNVPQRHRGYRKLGGWVDSLRTAFKKGTLAEDRISKLNSIGFTWNSIERYESKWNMRYSELMKYQREFGNCNVTQRYEANPQLGEWVITQRKALKTGRIRDDRVAKLNELGFTWNAK